MKKYKVITDNLDFLGLSINDGVEINDIEIRIFNHKQNNSEFAFTFFGEKALFIINALTMHKDWFEEVKEDNSIKCVEISFSKHERAYVLGLSIDEVNDTIGYSEHIRSIRTCEFPKGVNWSIASHKIIFRTKNDLGKIVINEGLLFSSNLITLLGFRDINPRNLTHDIAITNTQQEGKEKNFEILKQISCAYSEGDRLIIRKVKRLPDGHVFTIGDKIKVIGGVCSVLGFIVEDNYLIVLTNNNRYKLNDVERYITDKDILNELKKEYTEQDMIDFATYYYRKQDTLSCWGKDIFNEWNKRNKLPQ